MTRPLAADAALPPVEGDPDPGGADCVACGRCCHHGPSTVHLLDVDEARVLSRPDGGEILRRLTVLDAAAARLAVRAQHGRPLRSP
jgi:hypothetical protein